MHLSQRSNRLLGMMAGAFLVCALARTPAWASEADGAGVEADEQLVAVIEGTTAQDAADAAAGEESPAGPADTADEDTTGVSETEDADAVGRASEQVADTADDAGAAREAGVSETVAAKGDDDESVSAADDADEPEGGDEDPAPAIGEASPAGVSTTADAAPATDAEAGDAAPATDAEAGDAANALSATDVTVPDDATDDDGRSNATDQGEEVVKTAVIESASANTQEADSSDAKTTTQATPVTLAAQATKDKLNGVDISGWNDGIDFSKLGDFVIIKATEWCKKGYTYYTSGGNAGQTKALSYKAQADAALKAGKLIGFYHFVSSYAHSKQTYEQQAAAFVNAVKPYLGKCLLFLDWENGEHYYSNGSSSVYSKVESDVAGAKKWLDYVYESTGVQPMIYMNKNCSEAYNWSSVAKAGYDLWGAQYLYKYYNSSIKSFVSNPELRSGWGAWGKPTIYQYTSTANLHGNKRYDVNVFYGTKADWVARQGAKEVSKNEEASAKLLSNNAVYSFSPTGLSSGYVVFDKSGKAQLGSSSYRSGYWIAKNLGKGLYQFVNVGSGKLLSFSAKAKSGTKVVASAASASGLVSIWCLVKCTNGACSLVPQGYDKLRLKVSGGKMTTLGTSLVLAAQKDSAAQRFFFVQSSGLTKAVSAGKSADNGIYALRYGKDTSKLIDIAGSSTAQGANVQIGKRNATLTQRFRLSYKGRGLYTLVNVGSGKALEVAGGKTASGTNVQQGTLKNTLSQLWYLTKSGARYVLRSAASGLALEVAGGKTANGTNVQVYRRSDSAAQTFSLVEDGVLEKSSSLGKNVKEGIYTLVSASAQGKVIEVRAGSLANRANVQLNRSTSSLAQKFQLEYVGSGLYALRSAKSGKLLHVAGCSSKSGANVQQYKGTGSRAQLWYFEREGGRYRLCSAISGKALSLEGNGKKNGTNVCVETPAETSAQLFSLKQAPLVSNGTYTINSAVGTRVSVRDSSKSAGANVQAWSPNENRCQRWVFKHLKSGIYKIVNAYSGKALEVAGSSKRKGANVRQNKYKGSAAQKWVLTVTATGTVAFKNLHSGLMLDVTGAKKADGVNIQQYAANGGKAQSFVLRKG